MGFFSKLFGSAPKPPARPPRFGLDELARRLATTPDALQKIPVDYREIKIPKRSGGTRILHAPEAPLKAIQRTILRRLLSRLTAHPAAMGFERGQSIATHAAVHVGADVLLKMDIIDFFPRTTDERIRDYFLTLGWDLPSTNLLVKLTTHRHGLPQGAPTSPRLSNLVNYLLDARLFAMALKFGAKYTRYADDLTFSLKGSENPRAAIAALITWTKATVADQQYALHQQKKLRVARRHERMLVTGLVVNDRLNLPRETRRRLRAVRHHLAHNKPATLNPAQLAGWVALQHMIAQHQAPPPTSSQPSPSPGGIA